MYPLYLGNCLFRNSLLHLINTHDLSILCNAIEHGKITVLLTKFGIQYF